MTIRRKSIGALLLIVALATASLVFAFPESDGKSGMRGFGPDHGPRGCAGGCWDQLTDEQKEALEQLVQEMNDSGASPEEIRDAVNQYLEEQGIDTESCGMRGFGPDHGPRGCAGGCWDQLTDEQKEALEQLVQEMNDSGASPEEIRDAVNQYLEEQGIDTENCCCSKPR